MTATVTLTDRKACEAEVARVLTLLANKVGIPVPTPVVKWSLRGASCLGMARSNQLTGYSEILLHPRMLAALGDAYLDTVRHEACHIFIHACRRHHQIRTVKGDRGPWSPHGAQWRAAMRLVGGRPSSTCSAAEARALTEAGIVSKPRPKPVTVLAHCSCSQHHLSKVVSNRIVRGTHRYSCKRCGGTIFLGAKP